MEIKFKNKSYQKVCTDYTEAIKMYGKGIAGKIHHRMKVLRAAETEQDLSFVDRCHMLKGKRKTQYAVDLVHPFRLVSNWRKRIRRRSGSSKSKIITENNRIGER